MIDEQRLIETPNKRIKHWDAKTDEYTLKADERNMTSCNGIAIGLRMAVETIESQPKTGEWVPVSERLPEEYGSYLIAWHHINKELKAQQNGKHYYEICEYSPDEGWLSYYEQSPEGYEVVAWQPLPEPYRGDIDDSTM